VLAIIVLVAAIGIDGAGDKHVLAVALGRRKMLPEAEVGFRRLKAHKQLPILRTALQRQQQALLGDQSVVRKNLAA
jgi:hypothetical protein